MAEVEHRMGERTTGRKYLYDLFHTYMQHCTWNSRNNTIVDTISATLIPGLKLVEFDSINAKCAQETESGAISTNTPPQTPSKRLKLVDSEVDSFVHLLAWSRNSCHWDCMVAAFIPLCEVGLLQNASQMTEKAAQFFNLVKDVAEGMDGPMSKLAKVTCAV